MAQDISASFPEYWSRRMQMIHHITDRFRAIVSMEEAPTLHNGDKVHRPSKSNLVVNDMGSAGSYTRQDLTDTDESLTIDKEKEVSFYLREIDEIQSNYKTRNEYARDAAIKLSNQIDGDVFGEYDQATSDIDNEDIAGGTDNDGFTLSANNVLKVFTLADQLLNALNIKQDNRVGIFSPQFKNALLTFLAGRETQLGDATGKNGHIGRYMDFDIFISNNLGWSASLSIATLPTDGETVSINGVTFRWKDSIGTAGDVHIGASTAAVALAILVASINAPGTTVVEGAAAGFTALSAANQKLMKNITATDASPLMTLKATGKSFVVVSETHSATADIWTLALQIQHNLFGRKGAIDLVIQTMPNMRVKDRSGFIGIDVVTWTNYGKKTFAEGAAELVDVKIRSDNF